MKVLVLGATGMLGHMVVDYLSQDKDIEVNITTRDTLDLDSLDRKVYQDLIGIISEFNPDWVINCIGITRPHIDELEWRSVHHAIRINSVFPGQLAAITEGILGIQTITIATDCVYSGKNGYRRESDLHDALDTYGRTKSLGEVKSDNVYHLRCSIIGPELGNRKFSLLSKFLAGNIHTGYRTHLWNGITTLHFAKLCQGIIKSGIEPFHMQHVVPSDSVTKSELLDLVARSFDRKDLLEGFKREFTEGIVNHILKTNYKGINQRLWSMAGYNSLPSIGQMVEELAGYCRERKLGIFQG